jgi:hypothetical protein
MQFLRALSHLNPPQFVLVVSANLNGYQKPIARTLHRIRWLGSNTRKLLLDYL